MSVGSFAEAAARRFSAKPHVGVVMHFEGLDIPAMAERVRAVTRDAGLAMEDATEETGEGQTFNAVAVVQAEAPLEVWLVATEKAGVGCKLEIRVFHALEESAVADEYLAGFAKRFVT